MGTDSVLAILVVAASAQAQPDALSEYVQPGWRIVQGDDASRYTYADLTYSTETWYGSTFWKGPDWTRVGRDYQHSGTSVNSVRVFTAPQPGRATVTGRCYKADTKCGDGVALAIRHNGETVWAAEIGGADAEGVEFDLALELAYGDQAGLALDHRDNAVLVT